MFYLVIIPILALGGIGLWGFIKRRAIQHPDPQTLIIETGMVIPPEQVISLNGVFNFRDLGGYQTVDGRRVAWGKVYRSGTLSDLTAEDWVVLQQLGVKIICDLRSENERQAEPLRFPENNNAAYHHFPFEHIETSTTQRLRILFFKPDVLQSALTELYIRYLLELNAPIFGKVLKLAADPQNHPMIFHCTAGKDRTGLSAALLLLVLGVPEETVIADYTLSNRIYPHLLKYAEKASKSLRFLGIRGQDLAPLLVADARHLRAALDHLKNKYGSIEGYLREKAGVDDETIACLRENLLE